MKIVASTEYGGLHSVMQDDDRLYVCVGGSMAHFVNSDKMLAKAILKARKNPATVFCTGKRSAKVKVNVRDDVKKFWNEHPMLKELLADGFVGEDEDGNAVMYCTAWLVRPQIGEVFLKNEQLFLDYAMMGATVWSSVDLTDQRLRTTGFSLPKNLEMNGLNKDVPTEDEGFAKACALSMNPGVSELELKFQGSQLVCCLARSV